jgi:hypothetical protein
MHYYRVSVLLRDCYWNDELNSIIAESIHYYSNYFQAFIPVMAIISVFIINYNLF